MGCSSLLTWSSSTAGIEGRVRLSGGSLGAAPSGDPLDGGCGRHASEGLARPATWRYRASHVFMHQRGARGRFLRQGGRAAFECRDGPAHTQPPCAEVAMSVPSSETSDAKGRDAVRLKRLAKLGVQDITRDGQRTLVLSGELDLASAW